MAHSTGDLQNAIAQPLQDEIGHLAKFWGFTCWAFSDNMSARMSSATGQLMGLFKHHRSERTTSQIDREMVSRAKEVRKAYTSVTMHEAKKP